MKKKKTPWLKYTTRIMQKKMSYFRRFWVKELRHSEATLDQKGFYLCRSTRPQPSLVVAASKIE